MFISEINQLVSFSFPGPFLGLDWGKKWVGIAISDELKQFSMPLAVCSLSQSLHQLKKIWGDYKISGLIIGWPLHMNGQVSPTCHKIEKFIKRLPEEWPVAIWDERMTTKFVKEMALDHFLPVNQNAHAASFILQRLLDRYQRIKGEQNDPH